MTKIKALFACLVFTPVIAFAQEEHRHSFYEYHCATDEQQAKATEFMLDCMGGVITNQYGDRFAQWYCIYRGVKDNCDVICTEDKEKRDDE